MVRQPSTLTILIAGAILLGVAPATASVSIGVAPAIVELKGSAGGSGRVSITVQNRGDETFDVLTAVTELGTRAMRPSATDWVTVEPERMTIEPGEEASAELEIRIPAETDSGGHYAAVTFSTASSEVEEDNVGIAGQIIVPILLAVEGRGEIVRAAEISRVAAVIEHDGQIGVRAEVRNTGNLHVKLSGSAVLSSPETDFLAEVDIPERWMLRGLTRIFGRGATLPIEPGARYEVHASLDATDGAVGPFSRLKRSWKFEAATDVALHDLIVCETPGAGLSINVSVVNDGDLGVLPKVRFEVSNSDDAVVAAHNVAANNLGDEVISWPHETIDIAAELTEPLASGSYTLVATATYGLDSSMEASLPFSISDDPATAAPLCTPLASELDSTD